MMPPRTSLSEAARSIRTLSRWGAGVGVSLMLVLILVVVSTYLVFSRSEELSGPSDGSMFHGGEAFLAWAIGNLAAGFAVVILAIAALVLDISVLVKLSRLREYGVQGALTRPLLIATLTGMGLVSTPVGVVLMFIPSIAFGPGDLTNTVLLVLLALLLLTPVAGRIAQALTAAQLAATVAGAR